MRLWPLKPNEDSLRIPLDDLQREPNHFSSLIPREQLKRMALNKDHQALDHLGGAKSLLAMLQTDPTRGCSINLNASSPAQRSRRDVYGTNDVRLRFTRIFLLYRAVMQSWSMLILVLSVIVSLGIGIYLDSHPSPKSLARHRWCTAIIATLAFSFNFWLQYLVEADRAARIRKLRSIANERQVRVVRAGQESYIPATDIVVGDIFYAEAGSVVPCASVFLGKQPLVVYQDSDNPEVKIVNLEKHASMGGKRVRLGYDCFLQGGNLVLEGVGRCVAIAVGSDCYHSVGKDHLAGSPYRTRNRSLLHGQILAVSWVSGQIGFTSAAVLLAGFMTITSTFDLSHFAKTMTYVETFLLAMFSLVVMVNPGSQLAFELARMFVSREMMSKNLFAQTSTAWDDLSSTTCLCVDKTGTVTRDLTNVMEGTIGSSLKFAREGWVGVPNPHAGDANKSPRLDLDVLLSDLNATIGPQCQRLIRDAILTTSTIPQTGQSGNVSVLNNIMDECLFAFSAEMGWISPGEIVEDAPSVTELMPFDSMRKVSGAVVATASGGYRLYLKGASLDLVDRCTRHIRSEAGCVATIQATPELTNNVRACLVHYSNSSLRSIAICYRDFDRWPPVPVTSEQLDTSPSTPVPYEDMRSDLTLIGLFCFEDTLRPGVLEAFTSMSPAGVLVKMCTGDNELTARSAALSCGILTDGIIMEGPIFREIRRPEMSSSGVSDVQVLAQCSPNDKRGFVAALQAAKGVVAVTGDGANDVGALCQASVAFSFGLAGTEATKAVADIIILDDDITRATSALRAEGGVASRVSSFLQFHLCTVFSMGLVIFFSFTSPHDLPAFSINQILWIYVIAVPAGCCIFTTGPSAGTQLPRSRRGNEVFTFSTTTTILRRLSLQITCMLIVYFLGWKLLALGTSRSDSRVDQQVIQTTTFNTFVFMQLVECFIQWAQLKHIFSISLANIGRQWVSLLIIFLIIVGQCVFVTVPNHILPSPGLRGRAWWVSLVFAVAPRIAEPAFRPVGWLLSKVY